MTRNAAGPSHSSTYRPRNLRTHKNSRVRGVNSLTTRSMGGGWKTVWVRHRRLKTVGNWSVRLDPDGTYTVTSPTGHAYFTRPRTLDGLTAPTRSGKPIYLAARSR